MFLVSIPTALGRRWCAGCAISFHRYMLSVPNFWGFLVIECLFEEISGILSLYTSTQLQRCRCQVSREVLVHHLRTIRLSQARPSWEHEQQTGRHILGLSGGDSTALAILMISRCRRWNTSSATPTRNCQKLTSIWTHQGSLGNQIEYLSADRGFDHWMSMVDSCPHPRCAGDVLVYQIDFKQPLAQVLADVLDNEDDLPCLACHLSQ